jgi:hypothetical protein
MRRVICVCLAVATIVTRHTADGVFLRRTLVVQLSAFHFHFLVVTGHHRNTRVTKIHVTGYDPRPVASFTDFHNTGSVGYIVILSCRIIAWSSIGVPH